MSGLKAFNIVAMPKNLHSDPILKRRGKMLAQLEQQQSLANDAGYMLIVQKWKRNAEGVKELVEHRKRLKRWWLTDAAGDTLFVMRYGSRPLEIDKGKTAINVGKKENLIPVIDALITAVRNGELDEAVKALDRPRFKKKAA